MGIPSLTNARLDKGATQETCRAKCFLLHHVSKVCVTRERGKSQFCGGQLEVYLRYPHVPSSKAVSKWLNGLSPSSEPCSPPHQYPGSPEVTWTNACGKWLGREPEKNSMQYDPPPSTHGWPRKMLFSDRKLWKKVLQKVISRGVWVEESNSH